MTIRTVAIVAVPNVQLLDVSGPLDVFAEANTQAGRDIYRPIVLAERTGPLRSSSGVRLLTDDTLRPMVIDTLLVAGAPGIMDMKAGSPLLDWLKTMAPRVRRYGSVCSGACILAEAGLLDGRRVATHWNVAEQLARQFPNVTVDAEALYVFDGPVRTAAGVTAGMDLALRLVEEDLGRDLAMRVASQLVMFFKRPGGQLPFSHKGEAGPATRSVLQEVQRYVSAHPDKRHSVPDLAAHTGLSPRHFARLFREEIGSPPAEWVESIRIKSARALLEAGNITPKQVSAQCGFANPDTLRRAFVRHVGVSPADYRKRFAQLAL